MVFIRPFFMPIFLFNSKPLFDFYMIESRKEKEILMSVFLDEELFCNSIKAHNFVDVPRGDLAVCIRRLERETDEQFKERQSDFELLLFLLRAKNRQDVLKGITLADGSVKYVSVSDIAKLFGKLDTLLDGVNGLSKFLGTDMLFKSIDRYQEAGFEDDDLLF